MSFPRYPRYKDSGLEWLGNVPEHWTIERLSNVCRFQSGRAHEQFIDDDGPFICVNSRFVSTEGVSRKFSTLNFSPAKRNDILMVMSDLPNGRALAKAFFVSDDAPYAVNQRVCILSAIKDNPRFLFYLLDRNPLFLLHDDGVNQTHLSNAVFTKLPTQMPPLTEQTAIAAFLDRETAKIDGLVGEQRRLVELLKEKRQAVISHAVTKGLNPHAPMKPSGIEWLGDVPEHWEVTRLKFVTRNIKAGPFGSSLTKDEYVSAGYRVYGQEQVIPNDFTIGDYFIPEEKYQELIQCSVSPGDILISCVGTFGKIAIVPDDIHPGIINPRLLRIRCSSAINAQYLVEVLRSQVTFEQFALFTRGGTMDIIGIGTLSEIVVAVPPFSEQIHLLEFLRRETADFDALTAEAERAIDLLQERRTALISAAVTGKIDVRALAETEAA